MTESMTVASRVEQLVVWMAASTVVTSAESKVE